MSDRAQVLASAGAESSATAGDIQLRVREMELGGRALVSAESLGTVRLASSILGDSEQPAESLMSRSGRITTESRQPEAAASESLRTACLLSDNSEITTDVQSGTESGNVDIEAGFVDLDNSNVTADGGEGAGGNISIVVKSEEGTRNLAFPPRVPNPRRHQRSPCGRR